MIPRAAAIALAAFAAQTLAVPPAAGQTVSRGEAIALSGDLDKAGDMSALAMADGRLFVGVDEAAKRNGRKANRIAVFDRDSRGYALTGYLTLCLRGPRNCRDSEKTEMDVEAMAVHGGALYVIGSHARKRKRVDCDADAAGGNCGPSKRKRGKNRDRLTQSFRPGVVSRDDDNRDRFIRLTLNGQGAIERFEETSLRRDIDRTEPVASFARLASKENGVDIEGLAVTRDHIFIGFRGPVLRGNFVPVARIARSDFEDPRFDEDDVLFVNLGGLGIRDMAATDAGIVVLAGPVNDAAGPYRLYFWDGADMTPGRDGSKGGMRLLGEIDTTDEGKPEGLAVLEESDRQLTLLMVEDGAARPQLWPITVRIAD